MGSKKLLLAEKRVSEYFTRKGLETTTGLSESEWHRVFLKELIDNSLDALDELRAREKRIKIIHSKEKKEFGVCDSAGGIPEKVLDRIYDFNHFVSSKRSYRAVSRGAQGNALKTIIGICCVKDYRLSFVCDSKRITYRPDRVSLEIGEQEMGKGFVKCIEDADSENGVYISGVEINKDEVINIIEAYRLINPGVDFRYVSLDASEIDFPSVANAASAGTRLKKYNHSVHYYDIESFKSLLMQRYRNNTHETVKQFCSVFSDVPGNLLELKYKKLKGFFREGRPDEESIRSLYESLKKTTGAPDHRLFAKKTVGKSTFRKIYGKGLRYKMAAGKLRRNGATIPFVIEGFLMKDPVKEESPKTIIADRTIEQSLMDQIFGGLKKDCAPESRNRVLAAANHSIVYRPMPFKWDEDLVDFCDGKYLVSEFGELLSRADFFDELLTGYTLLIHLISPAIEFHDKSKAYIYLGEMDDDEFFDDAANKWKRGLKAQENLSPKAKLIKLTEYLVHDVIREVRRLQKNGKSPKSPAGKRKYSKIELMRRYFLEGGKEATGNWECQSFVRQVFYSVRRIVNMNTGHEISLTGHDSNRFRNEILTEFFKEIPWLQEKILLERRGFFYDPISTTEVPLGTKDTAELIKRFSSLTECESRIVPARFESSHLEFDLPYELERKKVLFIEKQGFSEVLKNSGILDELGLALILGQGFSTRAQKTLMEFFISRGMEVYVLHDCDLSGYLIHERIAEGGHTFERPLNVIDIGLTYTDLLDLKKVEFDGNGEIKAFDAEVYESRKTYNELFNKLSEEEKRFFFVDSDKTGRKKHTKRDDRCRSRRVEINALTTPELLNFLRRKIKSETILPTHEQIEKLIKFDDAGMKREAVHRKLEESFEPLYKILAGKKATGSGDDGLIKRIQKKFYAELGKDEGRNSWKSILLRIMNEEKEKEIKRLLKALKD